MNDSLQRQNTEPLIPYTVFATYLFRMREARGIRSEEMAGLLGITLEEYRRFEDGKALPNIGQMIALSRRLKIPPGDLKKEIGRRMADFGKSGPSPPAVLALGGDLEKVWDKVRHIYRDETGKEMPTKQRLIFNLLKKKLSKNFFPPLLPFNTLLILDAIRRDEGRLTHLREIEDFVLPGETLAGFIARDAILGPFMFYAANLFLHRGKPFQSLKDCLDRLTIAEFKELLFLGASTSGIYMLEQELGELQQHVEFCSLGVLAARELKPHLPREIDYNHLEMVLTLQGIGHHFLYTIIQPSLRMGGYGGELVGEDVADFTAAIDADQFYLMIYHLHPVVAAMTAADWNFPPEVVTALLTHHEHPPHSLTPLCALVKVINGLADGGFSALSEEDVRDLLMAYPNVKIPVECFLEASAKLNRMKDNLLEKSSTMTVSAGERAADFMDSPWHGGALSPFAAQVIAPRVRSDFRFHPRFQKTVAVACLVFFERLMKEMVLSHPRESMQTCLAHHKILLLRLAYLKNRNLRDIAAEYRMTEKEVAKLLKPGRAASKKRAGFNQRG